MQNTPNPTLPTALGGLLQSLSASFLFANPPPHRLVSPRHARIHPRSRRGEEKHLAGSFPGFHLEKQSNGFYGCSSPAQNIKVGFAHWSLQKGRMKTRVHICTFMSCHHF